MVRVRGDVVETRVADAALRNGHPAAIGPAVVAALTLARAIAGQVTGQRLAEILPMGDRHTPWPSGR